MYNAVEYYSAIKRNSVIFRDMDGPRVCQREWNKSEREEQIFQTLACMGNLVKRYRGTYWKSINRITDVEINLWLPNGEGRVGKTGRLDRIHTYIHTLLCIK